MVQENNELCSRNIGENSSIALLMLLNALNQPERPAFCKVSTTEPKGQMWFSWGQIANWVSLACTEIEVNRLSSGAHIASVEKNSVEWFVLDFACQILGYVHVAIDSRWPDSMVAHLIALSQAQLVFGRCPETLRPHPSRLQFNCKPDTPPINRGDLEKLIERAMAITVKMPAQMLFTSGTSGDPKGVLLSHRNLVTNAIAKLDAAPQFEEDLRLNILPFCHAYARTCELSTWVLSNSSLAIANEWSDFLSQAMRLQPTLINLVPHLANKLLHHEMTKEKLTPHEVISRLGGKVRLLQVGGAAIADALWYELERCGLPPLQGYGLTEASPVVCSNRSGQQRPGKIGPPVQGAELQVDVDGQLWVRGDGVMCGYYRDPLATQARIQDGWLATGDLVERDDLGHYRIIGRVSDVIVLSTGFKVSPELIEGRIENIANVEHALIVGQDQPYVVALIWLACSTLPLIHLANDDCSSTESLRETFAETIQQVLADLPSFMHPRRIILIADPIDPDLLTPKGNLQRKKCLVRLQSRIDAAYQ